MNTIIPLLLAFIGVLSFSGCIALPIPVRWKHQDSYSGLVIDQKTGHPIKGATVSSKKGENGGAAASAVTDETGAWTLPEVYGWHFGYWNAMWNDGTFFPAANRQEFGRRKLQNLTVSAPGYRTLVISNFHEWEERKWFYDRGFLYDPNPIPHVSDMSFTPMTDPSSVPMAEELANVSKDDLKKFYYVRLAPENGQSEAENVGAESQDAPAPVK